MNPFLQNKAASTFINHSDNSNPSGQQQQSNQNQDQQK